MGLLTESKKMKIKKNKNLRKRKWYIEYQKSICELISLLKEKENENDEEESDSDDNENEEEDEDDKQ